MTEPQAAVGAAVDGAVVGRARERLLVPQLLREPDGLVAAVLLELAGSGRRRQELLERPAADVADGLGAGPALAIRAEATVGTPRMPVLALVCMVKKKTNCM